MRNKAINWKRRMGAVLAAATLAMAWLPSPASAAPDPAKVCQDVARKAQRTLWSSVREAGDDMFCRKSWLPGRVDEMAACALSSKANSYSNKVKNLWNNFFQKADAEWGTWGPRGISVDWDEGTIRKGFKRTFFGAGLAYSKSTIEVVKEGGKAEAFVTVCALNYDGKVVSHRQETFPDGTGGEGKIAKVVLENKDSHVVAVVVDTPLSLNSFEYRARMLSEPIRNDLPAVKGIADLHVHQMVNLTFGGRMYWGLHDGPEPTALAKEAVNPTGTGLDLSSPQNLVQQLTGPKAIDANVLFATINSGTTDEGFFKYGGEGYPSYRDWPHHADRSHQQAHLSWVKEAHERGKESHSNLNLMVVSLVNNDILCSVAKTFDQFGNVPTYDSKGKIIGWESAPWGCSDHENVLRQLTAMHQIEKANPWYRIAMSPWHARQIIADGDLAVVVSMETDKPLSGEGGNYGNWEHQLDAYRALGLTSMQVVHESNSKFCGAARHRWMMQVLQLLQWPLKSVANFFTGSTFNVDDRGYNTLGLTGEGEKLVDAMVKRNMPIDIAHGSLLCRNAIMDRVGTDYGLYDSHTKFKRLLEPEPGAKSYGTNVLDREKEFLITESILPEYLKHKVLVGLRAASIDVYDAPNNKVDNDCPGSVKSFAQLVQYAHDRGLSFAYGTDFNTGVSQLGPRFGPKRCWAALPEVKDRTERPVGPAGPMPERFEQLRPIAGTNYYTHGLATIGWLPELTIDLAALGTPGVEKLRKSAEAYLVMWERTYPPEGTPPDEGPGVKPGSVVLGGSCKAGDECRSGRCTGVGGLQGVCVCNEDPDCGTGKFCNVGPDLKENKCEALKSDNDSCPLVGGGHACTSGHCKFGRCYTPNSVAMGGTCYLDDACAKGKCSSVDAFQGTCVCKEDEHCDSGYWCDKGADAHKNSCKRKLNKGEICGTTGELGVGHRCKSGDCKVRGVFSPTVLECK